jgi:hypothetical protein
MSLDESSVFNAHRSMWRTGDYDANVLIIALGQEGLDVQWYDKRLGSENVPLQDSDLVGLLLNCKSDSFFGSIIGSRHWKSLLKRDSVWYDLDSKFDSVKQFESDNELLAYLFESLELESELLLVRRAKS